MDAVTMKPVVIYASLSKADPVLRATLVQRQHGRLFKAVIHVDTSHDFQSYAKVSVTLPSGEFSVLLDQIGKEIAPVELWSRTLGAARGTYQRSGQQRLDVAKHAEDLVALAASMVAASGFALPTVT